MAESHVLSALKEKRARLAGDLKAALLQVCALRVDLGAVDQCLAIFGSDVQPDAIEPKITFGKSPAGLPKGAGTRTALEILRETGQPMSTPELAASVLQRWGCPLEPRALSMLVKTISAGTSKMRVPVRGKGGYGFFEYRFVGGVWVPNEIITPSPASQS